jgi:hypothetical protein
MRDICSRHDVLLIDDEIITGFCRPAAGSDSRIGTCSRTSCLCQRRDLRLSAARRHHGDAEIKQVMDAVAPDDR